MMGSNPGMRFKTKISNRNTKDNRKKNRMTKNSHQSRKEKKGPLRIKN
jgi:hypothetical protein